MAPKSDTKVKKSVKVREDTPDPVKDPKSFPKTPLTSRKASPEEDLEEAPEEEQKPVPKKRFGFNLSFRRKKDTNESAIKEDAKEESKAAEDNNNKDDKKDDSSSPTKVYPKQEWRISKFFKSSKNKETEEETKGW